jgi:hypothetical protein
MQLMSEKIPDNSCQEYHASDDHQIFRNTLHLKYHPDNYRDQISNSFLFSTIVSPNEIPKNIRLDCFGTGDRVPAWPPACSSCFYQCKLS